MAEGETDGGEEGALPEFFGYHVDATGRFRLDLRMQGMADLAALSVDATVQWDAIGPAPIVVDGGQIYNGDGPLAGLVAGIAIDPSGAADDTIYVASGYGGVWQSVGILGWLPKMDALPNLEIGAVCLDAADPTIVYAGTGRMQSDPRIAFGGGGLYKSLDSGDTWFIADGGGASLFSTLDINCIASPQANVVFVGTSRGLYYSIDGGANFGANAPDYDDGNAVPFMDPLSLPIGDAKVSCLVQDATSAQTVLWVALSGEGIYRITINADHSLTLSANLFFGPGTPAPGTFTDIQFGQGHATVAQPNGDRTLYASVQSTGGAFPYPASFVGLYKSVDAGATWTDTTAAGTTGLAVRLGATGANQSGYDFCLGVDPRDSNRIYAGFKQVWLSTDANCTFAQLTASGDRQMHWDQHVIVMSPHAPAAAAPTPLYAGNDGGLVRSIDGGANWTSMNDGVGTVLFYDIDIGRGSPANNAYTYGGAQDNMIPVHRPGDVGSAWHVSSTGDGGRVAVDPADPTVAYAFINEFFVASADAGQTWLQSQTPGNANITSATNASPIVVTATAHGFDSGDLIRVAGVNGNTAANDVWTITVIDANTFSLFGSAGNAPYTNGGTASRLSSARITVTGASNATPVVLTLSWHRFQTGDHVTVSGVTGNAAANGRFTVTRVSDTQIGLDGSAGNGNYAGGGTVTGEGLGRGLQSPSGDFTHRRLALVPNGANRATTVFVCEGAALLRSNDQGVNFAAVAAQPWNANKGITAVVALDATHLWVGISDGSVHFSADGGTTWDAGVKVAPGPARSVGAIAIDAANPQRVAVVFTGYAQVNPRFRTGNCYLSTDGGAHWTDASGTDGNPAGNLPDLPLYDAVFDTSTAPSTIVVATDGAVLASGDSGAHWKILGLDLPKVSGLSLAIDNAAAPRLLRVGTYGRGAFELTRTTGPSVLVEGNLGFGALPVGATRTLPVAVFNPGDTAYSVTDFHRVSAGGADFSIQLPSGQAFPIAVAPGASVVFSVAFAPAGAGVQRAGFAVATDAPGTALVPVLASGQGIAAAGKPRLAVRANLRFGSTPGSSPRSLDFVLENTGLGPLGIDSCTRTSGSGDFSLVGAPPATLAVGATTSLTVKYAPGSSGAAAAEFTVQCFDPRTPAVKFSAKISAAGVGDMLGTNVLKIVLIVIGALAVGAAVGAGVSYLADRSKK